MDTMGFKPLHITDAGKISFSTVFSIFFKIWQQAFSIDIKSLVVFHFPLHARFNKWLLGLLHWRGIQTAAIIVDIDGLRDKDPQLLKQEINLLTRFTYLVAHNEAMKNFLLQQLPNATILTIGLFDYPSAGQPEKKRLSHTVCIAGSFSKAAYVYQLSTKNKLVYHLYGPGYDEKKQLRPANIFYKGMLAPADLPAVIDGSFGLIWDGIETGNCDAYLQYNNPHKLSLYLAAGMPVIAWSQSAVAGLIVEKNIGITITDIAEIEEKINAFSENDYALMQQNAAALGEQIRRGYFLKNVLREMEELSLSMQRGG